MKSHIMSRVLAKDYCEKDVCEVSYTSGSFYTRTVITGNFPLAVEDWDVRTMPFLRQVPGGFVNLTRCTVPRDVSALLSYGPKFMLPVYTLMSQGESNVEFRNLIANLRMYGYASAGYSGCEDPLYLAHRCHTSENIKYTQMERSLLVVVSKVMDFLKSHRKVAIVVLGDKGKKVGLVTKSQFKMLCDDHINTAIGNGMYEEFQIGDMSQFLAMMRTSFTHHEVIMRLRNFEDYPACSLYVAGLSTANQDLLNGLNRQVAHMLSKVEWRFPVFSPTLKFHKDPLVLRPIISKCGSPSIALGLVIKRAMEALW